MRRATPSPRRSISLFPIITPGVSTVAGSGSAMLSADVTYFDPAFFKTPISQIAFNSSLVTPFDQVSPSALFTGLPGGGAPNIIPNIGTINGFNGKDSSSRPTRIFPSLPLRSPNPPASSRQVWACSGSFAWRLGRGDEKLSFVPGCLDWMRKQSFENPDRSSRSPSPPGHSREPRLQFDPLPPFLVC